MLFKTASLWLLVFVAVGQSPLRAEERYARIPAVGIELLQPEGFVVSKQWQGLEDEATGGGVQIMTIPGPFAEVTQGFTPDQLERRQMTLHEKTTTTIAGKPAILLKLTQVAQGIEIGKWIGVFGDKTTTMIVATYPKAMDDKLADVLKSIVVGTRLIDVKRRPLGENVDFKIGASQKLRLASDDNNTLLYTVDGGRTKKAPGDPLLIVTKSAEAVSVDIRKYALGGLMRLAETKITRVESNEKLDLGGMCQACEIIATGEDPSGEAKVVYERVIAYPETCFVIVGMVSAQRREEFLPEFQSMAKGFQWNGADEPAEAAAEGAPSSIERGPDAGRGTPSNVGSFGNGDLPRRRPSGPVEAYELSKRRPATPLAPFRGPDADSASPWEPRSFKDDRPKLDDRDRPTTDVPRSVGRGRQARGEQSSSKSSRTAKLGTPKQALPAFQYEDDRIQLAPEMGSKEAEGFEARAPKGGVLVGLRVIRGTSFGGSVQLIKPIFQIEGKYAGPGVKAVPDEDEHLLVAPPGYAVSGVEVAAGLWVDAIRLFYSPVDSARLNVDKHEVSNWVGGNGGSPKVSLSDGGLIVGIAGSSKENLESVQLMYVDAKDVKVAAPIKSATPASSASDGLRVWKSNNGKFNVNARLESFDGTDAKLITNDGRQISVQAEKLSDADQAYLKGYARAAEDRAKSDENDQEGK